MACFLKIAITKQIQIHKNQTILKQQTGEVDLDAMLAPENLNVWSI